MRRTGAEIQRRRTGASTVIALQELRFAVEHEIHAPPTGGVRVAEGPRADQWGTWGDT